MPLKLTKISGSSYYYVSGTVAGKRIRQSLKTSDREKAEQLKAHIESRLWNASIYGPESVAVFEDAALSYLEDGGEGRFVPPLLKHFRGRPLREITGKEIRSAAKALYPAGSAATRNRQAIAPARAIINHAADQGLCSPVRVKQFANEKPTRKAASLDWLVSFRESAAPHLAALAWFMFETGARISEAINLRPGDIDEINRRANLGKTKNGEHYHASFSAELRAELSNLTPRNGRIFGYKSRHSIYGPWATACKRANIPYIPPHQAGRHSLATTLEKEGWSANAIAQAGRWKSVRLVQDTYIHTDDKGKEAASQIGAQISQREEREMFRSDRAKKKKDT